MVITEHAAKRLSKISSTTSIAQKCFELYVLLQTVLVPQAYHDPVLWHVCQQTTLNTTSADRILDSSTAYNHLF
jgi:hypothetical protein